MLLCKCMCVCVLFYGVFVFVLLTYLVYFFFKVKNDLRFGSSFCDVAGSVCDLLSATAAESLWAFKAETHCDISLSSWACNKNSPPFESLMENGLLMLYQVEMDLLTLTHLTLKTCFFFV